MFIFLKHIIPVSSLCFGFTGIFFSQSYYHSPNDTLIAYSELEGSVTMNITQVHPTPDTLYFVFEKYSVDMPVGWVVSICDNSNCNTSLIDIDTTNAVLPGDDGLLLIHCAPHTNLGTATIRYTMREINALTPPDTLTWIIHANSAANIIESAEKPKIAIQNHEIKIYPQLAQGDVLSIFNVMGVLVFQTSIFENTSMLLPEKLAGIYFIQFSSNGQEFKQKILIQ